MRGLSSWICGAICAIVLATGPVCANPELDKVLLNNAQANAYGDKCPNWKVDWLKSAQLLESAGLDLAKLEEQPTFGRMTQAALQADEAIAGLAQAEVCRRAEAEFGPEGTKVPGLMSNGLAVRGINRLFDWLDK